MTSTINLLRLLADPTRLRLLLLLEQEELSVAELQQILGMGQSRISSHLAQLKRAGVVEDRRAGKNVYYGVSKTGGRNGARGRVQLIIETLAREIPETARDRTALKLALRTLPRSPRTGSELLHRALATASGAAGGTFGLAALPVELPVSTVIMLRSIADIAQNEGENLSDPEAALSCVEVFALGGRAGSADASESGYFAVRGMLAKTVTEAARFVADVGPSRRVLLSFSSSSPR